MKRQAFQTLQRFKQWSRAKHGHIHVNVWHIDGATRGGKGSKDATVSYFSRSELLVVSYGRVKCVKWRHKPKYCIPQYLTNYAIFFLIRKITNRFSRTSSTSWHTIRGIFNNFFWGGSIPLMGTYRYSQTLNNKVSSIVTFGRSRCHPGWR